MLTKSKSDPKQSKQLNLLCYPQILPKHKSDQNTAGFKGWAKRIPPWVWPCCCCSQWWLSQLIQCNKVNFPAGELQYSYFTKESVRRKQAGFCPKVMGAISLSPDRQLDQRTAVNAKIPQWKKRSFSSPKSWLSTSLQEAEVLLLTLLKLDQSYFSLQENKLFWFSLVIESK